MAHRTLLAFLVGLALGACASEGSGGTPPTGPEALPAVMDQLVAAGHLGLPRSALPAIYTKCAEADANGVPKLLPGEQCTLTYSARFGGDEAAGYTLREDIYVAHMGETDPTAELLPWEVTGGHYCTFLHRVEVAPVEGFPTSDIVAQTLVLEAVEDDETHQPCRNALPIGREVFQYAYRSERAGTFFFLPQDFLDLQQGSPLFSGFVGVKGCGCEGLFTTGPCADERGYMTYYDACTPDRPGTGGPGYCSASCRLFGDGNGLPWCTTADMHDLPANSDLIDPGWAGCSDPTANP